MIKTRLIFLVASILLGVAACGGSSSEPPAPPPGPPPITGAEAFQFLNQATFGATEADAELLIAMNYEAWIDNQMRAPATLQLPHMLTLPPPQFMRQLRADRGEIWFRNSRGGDDQLRQSQQGLLELAVPVHGIRRARFRIEQDRPDDCTEVAAHTVAIVIEYFRHSTHVRRRRIARCQALDQADRHKRPDVGMIEDVVQRAGKILFARLSGRQDHAVHQLLRARVVKFRPVLHRRVLADRRFETAAKVR